MNIAVIIVMIAVFVAVVFLLIFLIRCWLFGNHLVKNFKSSNTIVDGHKGKGKDLIFQYVINKRNKPYYSNICYGGKCENVSLKSISIEPNTYENFIEDKVSIAKRIFKERKDIYISDGGIYLPSYADSILHKSFKSLPLYYPMSRHIADSNVHVNIQNFNRLWKPLREQADFFVHVKGRIKLPHFILVHAVTYDKLESAEKYLEPMKTRFFNKFSKAEYDLYRAQNGEIKSGWVIIRKKTIKYDTRAFEKIIFGNQPRIYESNEADPQSNNASVSDLSKKETQVSQRGTE